MATPPVPPPATPVTIGIFCDLGPTIGAGHFVRSTALGAALVRAGATVEIAADLDTVAWTRQQAVELGVRPLHQARPDTVPELATERGWSVVVVDSYRACWDDLAPLTEVSIPLAAIDDEDRRPLPAQLVLNQNLTAAGYRYAGWPAVTVLRGPRYALLRPRIVAARPASRPDHRVRDRTGRPLRVLALLGGTDAGDGARLVAGRVLETLAPVELRVIGDPAALAGLTVPAGSTIEVSGPVLAVEELMAWADLAISAAGSTIWELCCLGVPMALVTVAANQVPNYRLIVGGGVAYGLGPLDRLRAVDAASWAALRDAADSTALDRTGRRGWELVDGLGADRVATAILGLVP